VRTGDDRGTDRSRFQQVMSADVCRLPPTNATCAQP
jgi:hypothetical protein